MQKNNSNNRRGRLLVEGPKKAEKMGDGEDKCYIEPIPCKNREVYHALNALICEYLEVNGLEHALQTFTKECQRKKLPCPNLDLSGAREVKAAFSHYDGESLLKSFDEGNLDNFLKLWKQFQTHIQVTSEDMKKLEVYIRVHFAIWPKAKNLEESKQVEAMQHLKTYFEQNSATLSSDATILPLFALPYVPDPKTHPIFKDLFQESWTTKLRAQLETTVNKYFELLQENITVHCKLASVIASNVSRSPSLSSSGRLKVRKAPSRSTGTITSPTLSGESSTGSAGDSINIATELETAIKFTESALTYHEERFHRMMTVHRKTRKVLKRVRENYSKLLKVSSILVAALEKALESVDSSHLDLVLQQCFAIYPEIFTNPSKACSSATSVASCPQLQLKPDVEHFKKLASSASLSNFLQESCDVSLLFVEIPDISIDNLNYDKIKENLTGEKISSTDKLCLLQALRWLITKTTPTLRSQVISSFVDNDLLGITAKETGAILRGALFSSLLSPTPTYQKESISRLINAFASTWSGRSYLSSTGYIIDTLIQSLRTFKTQEESFICHMVIASLQKLSLRKSMRHVMIEHNVVPWVVKYIKSELERDVSRDELHHEDGTLTLQSNGDGNYGDTPFNNYLMEYAWALLMNLCLHPESIRSALTVDLQFLQCIVTMLTNTRSSFDYTPYILSTLFSLLRSPELFQKAKAMNLDQKLSPIIPLQPVEIQTHMKHLLTQLYDRDDVDRLTASGETDYDDTDNPDPDEVEPELELQESWMNSLSETATLTGDDLLIKEYMIQKDIMPFPKKVVLPVAHDTQSGSIGSGGGGGEGPSTTTSDLQSPDSAHLQGSKFLLRPTTPTRSKSTRAISGSGPKNAYPHHQQQQQRRSASTSGTASSSVLKHREASRSAVPVHIPRNNNNNTTLQPHVATKGSPQNPIAHLMDLPSPPPSNPNTQKKIDDLPMPPPSPPEEFVVGLPPSPVQTVAEEELQRDLNNNIVNSFCLKESPPLMSMRYFHQGGSGSDCDLLIHFEKDSNENKYVAPSPLK